MVVFWPFWSLQHSGPGLGGGSSPRAENTARAESVLLAAARVRCRRERVGTIYTRFNPLDDVESIGATLWPLRGPMRDPLPWRLPHKKNMGSRWMPPSRISQVPGPTHPQGEAPPREGGTGQNDTKTGPNGLKMHFEAILDHLEATLIHFGPF